MEEYKTCTKCKQILSVENFGIKTGPKASKDGRRPRCKKCSSEDHKEYRKKNRDKVRQTKNNWAAKNKEKVAQMNRTYQLKNQTKLAEYNKKYYQENSEKLRAQSKEWRTKNKDRKTEMDKKWAKENSDKIRLASKRYREKNPERASANALRYARKNPEVKRQVAQKRRAKLKGVSSFKVTGKDIRSILRNDCVYCNSKSEHIDHVIPIARGGHHGIGNLVASCAKCNQSKNKMLIMEWRLRKKKDGY